MLNKSKCDEPIDSWINPNQNKLISYPRVVDEWSRLQHYATVRIFFLDFINGNKESGHIERQKKSVL